MCFYNCILAYTGLLLHSHCHGHIYNSKKSFNLGPQAGFQTDVNQYRNVNLWQLLLDLLEFLRYSILTFSVKWAEVSVDRECSIPGGLGGEAACSVWVCLCQASRWLLIRFNRRLRPSGKQDMPHVSTMTE